MEISSYMKLTYGVLFSPINTLKPNFIGSIWQTYFGFQNPYLGYLRESKKVQLSITYIRFW